MKTFREIVQEATTITIYHGGPAIVKTIDPKWMMTAASNNQEGIGIYFGNLDVASSYGRSIVQAEINPKKFIDSRESIGKYSKGILNQLLQILHKTDNEPLYYELTDWGVEVQEPEDVTSAHLRELSLNLKDEEVRNFQIDMAQKFGVEAFVEAWNKIYPQIHGTYNKDLGFYAVINSKIKVKPFTE